MRQNQAINIVQCSSYNGESMKTFSAVQTAETLEEINQKTPDLRDQFAMAAMGQLISGYSRNNGSGPFLADSAKEIAVFSYKYADAMMEARK